MGPTVCELEGPIPTLNKSKTLILILLSRAHGHIVFTCRIIDGVKNRWMPENDAFHRELAIFRPA